MARRNCEREYARDLALYLEYGRAKGYLDDEGEVDLGAIMGELWSWRTLVGLPPDAPFVTCTDRAPIFEPWDVREIWDCITAADPDAARMDAI